MWPRAVGRGRTLRAALILSLALGCLQAEGRDAYHDGERALASGDFERAWKVLLPLAKAGDARAQNDIGVMIGRGLGVPQSYPEAARWITLAAEQGNPYAQSTLGYLYYRGRGVDPDLARAEYWTRLAAEQGEANAQNNLGMLYDRGEGVDQDYLQAVMWYRRAAEQGFDVAQRNLGSMYEHGQGVEVDAVRAYAWYGIAAAAGDETALGLRERIARRMSEAELTAARALARELHERYAAAPDEAAAQ